jgi:hypothetical protein
MVSLSILPMMFDVRASRCEKQHITLTKEHLKFEDLFNKPFYLKFTIKILDWYYHLVSHPPDMISFSKNGAIFEINQNAICWRNPWLLCLNLCLLSHILVMLDVILGPKMCKARCFPLVALIWDPLYGLEITPKFTITTILIDSSPTI